MVELQGDKASSGSTNEEKHPLLQSSSSIPRPRYELVLTGDADRQVLF